MKARITSFIDALARTRVDSTAYNQYEYTDSVRKSAHAIRRNNLRLYLEEMHKRTPDTLLVGEAPGYQGSRLTGVPFMSEHIILKGVDVLSMFGQHDGYAKTDEYPDKIWKEPSATIVWDVMGRVKKLPLIWGAFPYHPHAGAPHTNRAPTMKELEIGRPFLIELIDLFGIKRVIAVGNQAQVTLAALGYDVPKVRHPSHGGKHQFTEGIREYIGLR
jgi:uracil-DNA glycosylase